MPGRMRQSGSTTTTCPGVHTRMLLGQVSCSRTGSNCGDDPFRIVDVTVVEGGVIVDFTVTYSYHGLEYITGLVGMGSHWFYDPNGWCGPKADRIREAILEDMASAAR